MVDLALRPGLYVVNAVPHVVLAREAVALVVELREIGAGSGLHALAGVLV